MQVPNDNGQEDDNPADRADNYGQEADMPVENINKLVANKDAPADISISLDKKLEPVKQVNPKMW